MVQGSRVEGLIRRDGTIEFRDRASLPELVSPPLEHRTLSPQSGELVQNAPSASAQVSLDVTEMILSAMGDDPLAPQKRALAASTRAFRAGLRSEACKEDLRQALLDIGPRLEAIWSDELSSPQTRRRKIFQLWDECTERGPDAMVQTSDTIRAAIYAFIQTRIPLRLGYSVDELAELNARRRSRTRFDPYETEESKSPDAGVTDAG